MIKIEVVVRFLPPFRESSRLSVKRLELFGKEVNVENFLGLLLADTEGLNKFLDMESPWEQQVLIVKDNRPVARGEIIHDGDVLIFLPPLVGG